MLNVPRKQRCPYPLSVLGLWPPSWKRRSVDQLFRIMSTNYFSRLYRFCTKWRRSSLATARIQSRSQRNSHLTSFSDMKRRVEEVVRSIWLPFLYLLNTIQKAWQTRCRLDTEKFGSIPDITDKERRKEGILHQFFPLRCFVNPAPFEKLDFEKRRESLSEAGCVRWFLMCVQIIV